MDVKELYEWAVKNDVERKTREGFRDVINNLIKESPKRIESYFGKNFDEKLLNVTPYRIALVIGNWPDLDFNFIASYARVEYAQNDMGQYKLIFGLDGEIEDDYWESNND